MNAALLASRRPRLALHFALMVSTGLATACAVPEGPGRPYMTITPTVARLPVGDTIRFRATVDDRPCDCLWTSSDGSRMAVDLNGLSRALAPGMATVTATLRGNANARASAVIELLAP